MGEPAFERDDPGRDEGRAELSSRYFAWSQATQIPHCMIAVSLDLIWGNAAAMRMLKAGEDFQLVNGMLCCADKADTASLRQFIAGLDNGVAAWACRRRDEEGFRVIRAERAVRDRRNYIRATIPEQNLIADPDACLRGRGIGHDVGDDDRRSGHRRLE